MARVLIVEDEPNNLDLARRIVAQIQLDPLAERDRPALILLDLQLPHLDGWTVVKTLRLRRWARDLPIVAISASATPGDEAIALEAGCTEFVAKPYYPDGLREVLERHLTKKK